MHFIRCDECEGIGLLVSSGPCCTGEDKSITPNCGDAPKEAHLPKYTIKNDELCVWLDHPCEGKDYIDFIYVETKEGALIKKLKRSQNANCIFYIKNDEVVSIYAHCVKHGIWKIDL